MTHVYRLLLVSALILLAWSPPTFAQRGQADRVTPSIEPPEPAPADSFDDVYFDLDGFTPQAEATAVFVRRGIPARRLGTAS